MTLESLPSNPDEISTSQVPNYDGAGVRTSVDGSSKGPPIKQKMVCIDHNLYNHLSVMGKDTQKALLKDFI